MNKITLMLLFLTGCQNLPIPEKDAPRYCNHVSDVPLDRSVRGVTYNNGPVRPTIIELLFMKLHIKGEQK